MEWFVANDGKHKYAVAVPAYLWNRHRNDKITRKKIVKFGSVSYEHFKDRTPIKAYTNLNHLDPERRKRYYQRHNKDYPKYSPDWFSKKYLW